MIVRRSDALSSSLTWLRRLTVLGWIMALSTLAVTTASQQTAVTLEAASPIEREIVGGQTHSYQVKLTAGQFARIVVEQRAIDVALILTAPDDKPVVEVNLSSAGGTESLSAEATLSGAYRLTVRALGADTLKGTYRAQLEIKPAVTNSDRQRISAERLLVEAEALLRRGSASAQTASEKLLQALASWRELGDQYWEATTLNYLGRANRLLSRYEQAIEYAEQARVLKRAVKDRAGEAFSLDEIGSAYNSLGRSERALEYHAQALIIVREVKDRAGEAGTLLRLGNATRALNRYEQAAEYYQQALVIYREVKNRTGESDALTTLGNAQRFLNHYEKAIEYYEQALALSRELKNRNGEGNVLNNLGIAYRLLGRYEKALEYYEQTLAIYREVKFRNGEGGALNNLGIAYSNLGQYEKAIEHFEQALVIFREVKDRNGEGLALNNLGLNHRLLGRSERALPYHEQALAIYREVKNRDSESLALNNLGLAYRALNQTEKAIQYHEQALTIARAIKARGKESEALAGLGEAYRAQGQYPKAAQAHVQALTVARQIKELDSQAMVLNDLMLDWKASSQLPLAVFYGKQAVNAYQEIRNDLRNLDRASQQSFIKSKEETYRTLADLLISQGRLPEAEEVITLLKQEEYFDFIRRDASNAPQGGKAQLTPEEAALEKRYHEISDQIAELGTERDTLMSKNNRTAEEDQRLAKLDADLVVAGNAFQKFLSQLETELGASAQASAKTYALRESQGLMQDLRELGANTVALYTLITDDKYHIILTTPDFQKGYDYAIKAADLNRKVLEFREVLQNPKLDPLPLAQELYKILLGPVAKDLEKAKAKTLMWSLDGVLRYVPISALHDGKQYMVERYRSAVFTPASQARLLQQPAAHWDALGLGVTKAHGERIAALPGVLDEMRGIIQEEGRAASAGKVLGVLPGVVKLDEQFTQEAMLAELRRQHKVVHIASHFQFQPGNETNSALLLGDGSFLSLAQIKTMPNIFGGVELLTLSACNTATGGSGANGKEVEGFGVLAQRQGAKAVVASLWPVFDTSTKELMQEFYRLREAKSGSTKIEALRQAQLELLRGTLSLATTSSSNNRQIVHEEAKPSAANKPLFKVDPKAPYAHPYYWAPFILIGNWK